MENNITKIHIKKFWKRFVTFPLNSLQRGMTLPFWYSLSLMILPSEAPALPPPRKKKFTLVPLKKCKPQNTKNERVNCMMEAKLELLH